MQTPPPSPSSIEADFFPRLAASVLRRFQNTRDKSLKDVYHLDPEFLQLDDSTLRFALENRLQILHVLDDPNLTASLVNLFLNNTLQFTYASNQYVPIGPAEQAVLRHIYEAYVHGMRQVLAENDTWEKLEKAMGALVHQHFQGLRQNIQRFFDPETQAEPLSNWILSQVICHEYSPKFQVEMLGLAAGTMMEPVLDLGCGKRGDLVQHLRSAGLQAVGVDHLAEPAEYLIRSDWLSYRFEPETWGAIISHMAFSNHFIFHHLYKHGQPERYARQYRAILASLKPGGSFLYTPGLPFIEQYLPEQEYVVQRRGNIATHLPGEGFYVAQVTKRSR